MLIINSLKKPGNLALRSRIAWAAGLLLAATSCAPLQWGDDQVPDINVNLNQLKDAQYVASMPAQVDNLMADFLAATGDFANKRPIPGCAVGIMDDNSVAHLKGYGVADLNTNAPFTFWTPSVLGSVSKTWTALAALRLVELNLLSLDDTVADYLPSAPASWQNKTIRQLLSHTSGLAYMPTFNPAINNEVELSQFWFNNVFLNLGIHPRLVWVSYTQTPDQGFDDGETARYSNVGYMLIGAIIDNIAAQNIDIVGEDFDAFESFVWRQVGVFDGNLNNGDQMFSESLNEYWRQADVPGLAKGYEYDSGSDDFDQVTFFNSPLLNAGPAGWEGPAGGWTASIGDVVRLMAAIQNDDIIASSLKQNEMLDIKGSDNNGNWGLGVNLITKLGLPVYMHDGSYPGYRARYTVWPSQGVGVAVMCNESSADMRSITDAIGAVFVGGGIAPGAAGAAEAPFAPADDRRRQVDENDPPLMAETGREQPPPDVSDAVRRETAAQLTAQRDRQLAKLKEHERLAVRAERLQCARLVGKVVDDIGFDAAALIADCATDVRNRGQLQSCVVRAGKELAHYGVISERERGWLARCATVIDIEELKRLAEGEDAVAPRRR